MKSTGFSRPPSLCSARKAESQKSRNKLSDEYREVADDPATGGGSEAKTWLEVELLDCNDAE